MGELLDRNLQRHILSLAAAEYPDYVQFGSDRLAASNEILVNAAYLAEHGLLRLTWHVEGRSLNTGTITAKGLDFLADDGGLSAVLGVVTIKLHDETIKALILDKIDKSNQPAGVRRRLKEQVKSLPADVLKEMTMGLFRTGVERIPDFVGWLRSYIEHA